MPDKKVTIVIPTKDRPIRLKNSLDYYTEVGYKGSIIIADSSTGQNAKDIASLINEAQINIRLFRCLEQKHDGDAIKSVNGFIETPYSMYCGDDDVAIHKGLIECVEFLEESPDYTAASGIKRTKIQSGDYVGTQFTSCLEMEADSIVERFATYIRSRICTTYYVHRTEVWQQMFQYADEMPNRWLGGEVLPCCISAMSGKIKNALRDKSLYAIHRIDSQDSWIQNISLLDMMMSHDYVKSLQVMREVIVTYFVQAGIELKIAEKVYEKELWLTTLALLMNKFVERYPHLKVVIDQYSKSLETYPYEWRRPTMSPSIVADQELLAHVKNGHELESEL